MARLLHIALATVVVAVMAAPLRAAPMIMPVIANAPMVMLVSGGHTLEGSWLRNDCPAGYWRGPWGHCRNTSFSGHLLGGR